MLEQMFLREQFEELLVHQQNALGGYESVASSQGDDEVRLQLDQLLKDKKRHILLTQRLLEIVE